MATNTASINARQNARGREDGLPQLGPPFVPDEGLQVGALGRGRRDVLHDVEDRQAGAVLVGEADGVGEGVPGLQREVRGEEDLLDLRDGGFHACPRLRASAACSRA